MAPYRRGNAARAAALVQQNNRGKLNRVIEEFEGDFYADSTKKSMLARFRLWCKLAIGLGCSPLPVTIFLLTSIAAILKHSGYRSTVAYIQTDISYHTQAGYELTIGRVDGY
ncbi:hypothetical protein FOL47_011297 [Perkinsus chesapeaki]|uniref:Uncharacterized protein n=1 Tax=Perkinsus chesapeaki TaxID=330153 RepID=A0A7J6KXG6_PERCH|nr:hypothetical protein FOL47_011297 [Perkinsus chesapeaki]